MASSIPRPRASLSAAQGLSPVMKVPLGSRVVLSRRRNGTLRYVGKLAGESGEWYGVALDEPKGDSDGMRGKERYFFCPPNHGVFVRRKEIYCVKEPGSVLKEPPSPVTDESSSCSSNVSNTSADQQGEAFGVAAMGIVHPAPTNAESLTAPLMKTFKGFRKQLDFISLRTVGPGRSREASPVTSPASSSPSSPTAKSGLKPPSPFRRFASFSQGLPIPASPESPTNKSIAALTDDRRRQSAIPLSPKPSPVRRTNSFRTSAPDSSDGSTRPVPVEITSPSSSSRFSSFQYSPTNHFPVTAEASTEAATVAENDPSTLISATDDPPRMLEGPGSEAEAITTSPTQTIPMEDERTDSQITGVDTSVQDSSSQSDTNNEPPVESSVLPEIFNAAPSSDVAVAQGAESEIQVNEASPIEMVSGAALGRTSAFHVPPLDISAIAGSSVKDSPTSEPQEPCLRCSGHSSSTQDVDVKAEDTPTLSSERTRSFRLSGRSSSFRVTTIDTRRAFDASQPGSAQCSPLSSPENSPPPRSDGFAALSFDRIRALDCDSDHGLSFSPGSVIPSPRDDISEASAASAPEPRLVGMPPQRSPRSRQEHTAVESMSPGKKLVDSEDGSGERPLFFRRMNVGRSPMERRSSYSSFSNASSSPSKTPTSSNSASAAARSSRVAELEKEIGAMRSSHENIVAVLRATNKQHAANVLELRAQVAALTEGNLWLERQLTAKGELVRELREMEKQQQRDSVSVSEVEKILEIKDAQIQTLEREMAQLRHRLARLESDKDSQLYQQFQHFEARRDRDEKRINELRKEVLAMCTERLELQSEVRDLKEMSLHFF